MRPSRWPVLQEGYPLVRQVRASLTLPCLQVKTEISVESKHQTLQGLTFPLQPAAQRALQQLRQKTVNYIQLVGACPAPDTRCPGPGPAGTRVRGGGWVPGPPTLCTSGTHCAPPPLRPYLLLFGVRPQRRCPPALLSPCLPAGTSVTYCPSLWPLHCTHILTLECTLTPQT